MTVSAHLRQLASDRRGAALVEFTILAPLLMTEPDAASAFRRFESLRRPRVDRVRKTSNFNGFAYHMEWPFTLGRDSVLMAQGPRGHLKRLDWLYGYDAAPEPEVPPPDRTPRMAGGDGP